MRFTTFILAATSLVISAQQAGAVSSPSDAHVHVVDGHLHLLSARSGSGSHSGPLPNTRRHHMKKVRRANGVCKKKAVSSSTSTSSSSSAAPAATSSNSNNDDNNTPSASATSSPASTATQAASNDDDVSPIANGGSASSLGSISAFQGQMSGIGSWFRTNAGNDHTNGQSWCETWYKDDWKCFAPSVGLMLDNFGGDRVKAGKAYCGREVKFTTSSGKTALGFICDGFDDTWAKRSGNSDLTIGLFTSLYGSFDNNKNTVMSNLKWELTGNVVEQGTFQKNKYNQKA